MTQPSISLDAIEPIIRSLEKLTQAQRAMVWGLTLVAVVGLFVYVSYIPKTKELNSLEDQYSAAQRRLVARRAEAARLPQFRLQRKEVRANLEVAKRALPEEQEIPALLADISESSKDSLLELVGIRRLPDRPHGFFADIPLSVKVIGGYHSVALFFSKVSQLSRIVNIENISMRMPKGGKDLETSFTAIAYRFVEAPPEAGKKG